LAGPKKQKTQMKFFALASAALIATTSAVHLNQVPSQGQLVSMMASQGMDMEAIFDKIDQNGDGFLQLKEVMDAVRYVAKEQGIKLPKGWKK